TGWPFLKVLPAAPVPPVTLPVTLIRCVPARHLRRVACRLSFTLALVVPLLLAHLSVAAIVPDVVPALKVPDPSPPVAASGVHDDTVATILPPGAFFVVSFLHVPGWVTAPAGPLERPLGPSAAGAPS